MPDYIETRERITFLILNKDSYDANVLRVWNENLKDIISMYILEKIYKFRILPLVYQQTVASEKITKETELTGTISSRKTPVRRSVHWL